MPTQTTVWIRRSAPGRGGRAAARSAVTERHNAPPPALRLRGALALALAAGPCLNGCAAGSPGPARAPSSAEPPQGRPAFEARPRDDWRKTAGAIGVGVGTTLVAVGASASIRISKGVGEFREHDNFIRYREGIQRGGNMCDAADRGVTSSHPEAADVGLVRERCRSIAAWKAAQTIGYVGGGLLIAGGAGLLVSTLLWPQQPPDESARAGRVRLRFAPTLGPTSAGATLGGTW
jgi:hypothetical protein